MHENLVWNTRAMCVRFIGSYIFVKRRLCVSSEESISCAAEPADPLDCRGGRGCNLHLRLLVLLLVQTPF